MNPAAPPEGAPTAGTGPATPQEQRLAHLFRLSLQQGRIHPLYLPLQKYRQDQCRPDPCSAG